MAEDKKGFSAAQWAAIATIVAAVLGLCGTLVGLGLNCVDKTGNVYCYRPAPTAIPLPGQTTEAIGASSGGQITVDPNENEAQSVQQTAIALTNIAQIANATQTASALIAISQGDDDRDGLSNADEARMDTNPSNPDSDADALNDGLEISIGTNPNHPDSDNDGLSDGIEVNTYHTNPTTPDSDGDGLLDQDETNRGTNPTASDSDRDGLSDKNETDKGTNPIVSDTDGDGLNDGQEISQGTNPTTADSDGDGWNDGVEVNVHHTNPNNPDTDGDGLTDSQDNDPRVALSPCQTKTFTYALPTSMEFKPLDHTKGDTEFGGNGPDVFISVNLRVVSFSKTRLVFNLEVSMSAVETKPDTTTIIGSWTQENAFIVTFDNGYVFDGYISRFSDVLHYRDFNHDPDTKLPDNTDGLGPVKKFVVIGDSEGSDLGKTKVTVYFNPLKFKIKQSVNCR